MKKQILSLLLLGATLGTQAQTTVADSVQLGAGYPNEIWYSLENDEQGSAAYDEWDIAFEIKNSTTSSIFINSAAGAMLWNYPKGDKTAWGSIDTAGLSTWDARYNDAEIATAGAMGRYADPNNQADLDWGIYDFATHVVAGDSVYIIKLVNGDFKKLYIEKLLSGVYHFKHADLDGANEKTVQVAKSSFSDKNLGFYSISGNKSIDREPKAAEWDLLFTSHTAFVPIAYTVRGVIQNRDVEVAKAENLPNKSTYNNYQAHTLNSEINTIGHDWKTHVGMGNYEVQDSMVYFVSVPDREATGESIWKLEFTGFASADGKFVFNKTLLKAASVAALDNNKVTLAIAPNPSNGQPVQVVYNIENTTDNVVLHVTDMAGRTIMAQELKGEHGLHTYALPTNTLSSGMYIVSVNTRGGRVQQKLLIN